MLDDKRSFEKLLRESGAAMLLLDDHGVIQEVSDAAIAMLGGTPEEYRGKNVLDIVDPVDRYFVRRKWEMHQNDRKNRLHLTVRLRKNPGRSAWHDLQLESGTRSAPNTVHLLRIEHVMFESKSTRV